MEVPVQRSGVISIKELMTRNARDGFQLAKGDDLKLTEDQQRAIDEMDYVGDVPKDQRVSIFSVSMAQVLGKASGKDGESLPHVRLEVVFRGVAYVSGKVTILVYRTYTGVPGMR